MPARKGPFSIRGVEYSTDTDGAISRTEPAIAAQVSRQTKAQLVAMRVKAQTHFDAIAAERNDYQARMDEWTQTIADLDELIDAAAPDVEE